MEFVNTVIFPALATILTGLASWGVAVLVNWANSKIKNEAIRVALKNTRDIIMAEVAKTAQNFVDDLKKNGEFSTEKQAAALKMTLENVKKQLTAEAAVAVNAITSNAEEWLLAEIEKAVKNSKEEG